MEGPVKIVFQVANNVLVQIRIIATHVIQIDICMKIK
jgi:hypothetical protein